MIWLSLSSGRIIGNLLALAASGFNVVGELPGSLGPAQKVLVAAHHDAYFRAGLDDTGGGGRRHDAGQSHELSIPSATGGLLRKCPSCIKINSSNHADIIVVEPEGEFIKIDQVREMQKRRVFNLSRRLKTPLFIFMKHYHILYIKFVYLIFFLIYLLPALTKRPAHPYSGKSKS
jgi:hypothetical protein